MLWLAIKIFIAIILVSALILYLIGRIEYKRDNKIWNNGCCNECEKGHYKFNTAVGHSSYTTYIYKCDKCGHIIETSSLMY